MNSPKNTWIDLVNLGVLLKGKLEFIKHENEQIKDLKTEIRNIMIENDLRDFEDKNANLSIKCSRSFSFDLGMFKLEEEEISKKFVKEETVTTIRDVFDKKNFQKLRPELYKKYLVENTARLTVR